jgi:hypothetical protein
MYRDDEIAGAARANALIDEIADLERGQVAAAEHARRLAAARQELADLRPAATTSEPHGPGIVAHVLVLAASAMTAFLAYSLMS